MIRRTPHQQGQVMLTIVILALLASVTIVLGVATPILKQVQISKENFTSMQSFYIAESSLEDVVYRFQNSKTVSTNETLVFAGGTSTIVTMSSTNTKQIVATATINNDVRKMQADIVLGTGVSFHYGVQAGTGGFSLSNSSSVTGNIFSGGPIVGAGNLISGDAVSSGASGFIQGVHVTGSAYSHTLGASGASTQVDKDAYYQSIAANVTVGGTKHPGSADQVTSGLPITDDQISGWESDAAAGGTMLSSQCDSYASSTNTCTISSNKSLGPLKIPFNLLIKSSSGVLTVTGPLWVTGNITAQTGPTIQMSPSLGSTNVAIIADDPSNLSTGSVITIGQSTIFQGSGSSGSFVFMISQNNSAETGGTNDAVTLSQGASALVAYAIHGQISLGQSVSVKEVTAYKINLTQSANVTYDTGLPSTLFASGPSGGYDVLDWKEIQ